MRVLLLFRGAPGCGKSTYIDNNGLRPYTLSADEIRLQCESPQQNIYGKDEITCKNDKLVWKTLFKLLETRMSKGEFTVIDATNSRSSEMNKYKKLAETYRYRIYCIDFTNLPIEECKARNASRIELKQVPEEVIDKMYSRFQNQKIPTGIKVIKSDELDSMFIKKFDMSKYEKIVHIGDIHGSYTALMEYFKDGLNDNYMYIFCGDYIDRGIENIEVIKFLLEIYNKPNVLLLEGNHECFHKDTEVLTTQGWKLIYDIDKNTDVLAQFNINTLEVTFAKPIEIISNFADKLVDIETFNTHQVVTLNHDIVYNYGKIKASELLNNSNLIESQFPMCGNIDVCDYDIADDDLRLMVWIISDGTIVRDANSIKTRIQFHLSRQDKIDNLCALLNRLNIKYSISADRCINDKKKSYQIRFYGDSARKYDKLLNSEKVYPIFFTKLSNRQSRLVIDEIVKTDGSKRSSIEVDLSTISKHNADIIQWMCVTHGMPCVIRKVTQKAGYNIGGTIYLITIKMGTPFPSYKVNTEVIDYNDNVYCVSMPMGTVITRYSGKIAFTGNCHMWRYANNAPTSSKEFELVTKPQLENSDISNKDLRQLYRKLGQCAWYTYGDKEVLVTHGGVATLPKNLGYLATEQMIKGVGNYNDYSTVAETWLNTTADNMYQIFGHRNTRHDDVQLNDRVFNLEGQVEFGGHLRIVELDKDGFHTIEIKNNVFREIEEFEETKQLNNSSIADIVINMRNNKFIIEKPYGNISSFNFSKKAFYDDIWNEQTVVARGLYINTNTMKIVTRGYDKYFKVNERPETKLDILQHKLQFPVTCYVKENGYLGLVSYNEETDDLFITTKSSPEGDYAVWLREIIDSKMSESKKQEMKAICKNHNVTFAFECVDIKRDPHIIEYPENELFLLAIIRNDINFSQFSYEELVNISNELGLKVKTKAFEIDNWSDFYDWYYEVTAEDYEYNGHPIEGFVIEDAAGYMVKIKGYFYNYWKKLRSVAHSTLNYGHFKYTQDLITSDANNFYAFCQKLYNEHTKEEREQMPKDIIYLRNLFYKQQ